MDTTETTTDVFAATIDGSRSRRRNPNATMGFVNFPTTTNENSCEGGCFVRLVVIDTRSIDNYHERIIPCCGGYQSFVYDEMFVGDDTINNCDDHEQSKTAERRHFPNLSYRSDALHSADSPHGVERYLSANYLCVITVGATGWSPSSPWVCTVDDLTENGIKLYKSIQALYPNCELRLLTFLDT